MKAEIQEQEEELPEILKKAAEQNQMRENRKSPLLDSDDKLLEEKKERDPSRKPRKSRSLKKSILAEQVKFKQEVEALQAEVKLKEKDPKEEAMKEKSKGKKK